MRKSRRPLSSSRSGAARPAPQFDPCYHAACDSYLNFNAHALEVNSELIAVAALTFAYSTESVNGVKGKPVPGKSKMKLPTPAGPRGTFVP